MLITSLIDIDHSKTKVYIDEELAFILYPQDLKRYHIKEGNEISEEHYNEIREEIIYRRGKQKAIAMLKYMDRSEHELRSKLKLAFYPDDIIDRILLYIKEYGYVDDERLALAYIRAKIHTKSKLQIQNLLIKKGIKKEVINNIFSNEEFSEDLEDAEEIAVSTEWILPKATVLACP